MDGNFYTQLGWLPSVPEDFRSRTQELRAAGVTDGMVLRRLASYALNLNQLNSLARLLRDNELQENPLGASLSIRAKETSQYEGIANFLESDSALSVTDTPIIDKVNYFQNKVAIDKLTEIIESSALEEEEFSLAGHKYYDLLKE